MIEGKTKYITLFAGVSFLGRVTSKDDITAGDGARHDVVLGKAKLATRITCNVFEALRRGGVESAYIGRIGPTSFLTYIVDMIPVEVVVRGEAQGSYCKRNPSVRAGTKLGARVVEFFYKTKGRRIGELVLPGDDPLMIFAKNGRSVALHRPDMETGAESYIADLLVTEEECKDLELQLHIARGEALKAFDTLARYWMRQGGTLQDIKFEYGVTEDGTILLADVVDCDSWRVMWRGIGISKQPYRDGDDPERVLEIYRLGAALTDQFLNLPVA